MAVSWRKDGICGFVVLDNPPVNAINREIREGLLEAVDWAEREGLERVIVSGAGPAFAAGADARNLIARKKHRIFLMFLIVLSSVRYHGLLPCMARFLAAVRNWRWRAVTVWLVVMLALAFRKSSWASFRGWRHAKTAASYRPRRSAEACANWQSHQWWAGQGHRPCRGS